MKAYEYILAKQVQWAMNRGIAFIVSKGLTGKTWNKKLRFELDVKA